MPTSIQNLVFGEIKSDVSYCWALMTDDIPTVNKIFVYIEIDRDRSGQRIELRLKHLKH